MSLKSGREPADPLLATVAQLHATERAILAKITKMEARLGPVLDEWPDTHQALVEYHAWCEMGLRQKVPKILETFEVATSMVRMVKWVGIPLAVLIGVLQVASDLVVLAHHGFVFP